MDFYDLVVDRVCPSCTTTLKFLYKGACPYCGHRVTIRVPPSPEFLAKKHVLSFNDVEGLNDTYVQHEERGCSALSMS